MNTGIEGQADRDSASLFVLNAVQPLRPQPLSDDMLDALNDSDVSKYAPGILSIICEWMELHHTHSFSIRASNTKDYFLTTSSSMLSCLEQLPSLMEWVSSNASSVFCLDINEQGSDLRIEFSRSGENIRHACIEDHWQTASRVMGDWVNSASSLRHCCRAIAQEVARTAVAMNANVENLPAFRDWCVKCMYDLETGRGS